MATESKEPTGNRLHVHGGAALARLIKFVDRTSRLVVEPPDGLERMRADHPAILTCWHGQFLMAPAVLPKGMPLSFMVARHGDAELISVAIARFGHRLIRGAGAGNRQRDRGGAAALRGAMTALRDGRSVAMTSDVPPGPARQAGLGIVTLARLSGRPIIPTGFASSRAHVLKTWSRLTINLPYSTVAVVAGEPIQVARDADDDAMEQARMQLERALDAVNARAHAIVGRQVPELPKAPRPLGREEALASRAVRSYRSISRFATPIARAALWWRTRQGKEDPERRGERIGIASRSRPDGQLVWIHAASVGETIAILPLIAELRRQAPEASVLLTTGTRTSAEIARTRLPEGTLHQFVPVDVPGFVNRFLDHWQPDLALFTESELWPNLILESATRGIKLALINARMSSRSFSRWRRRPAMAQALLGSFDLVLAQNEKLARRFRELGAPGAQSVGNLKIDAPPPPVDDAKRQTLNLQLGSRPRFLAASTHPGEEAVVAAAHIELAREFAGLSTMIVPRHPHRGPEIAQSIEALGLKAALRSAGGGPTPDIDVYIADTIGELGTFYAIAPVAFVGGSLIEHGGQNPIEAVRHGTVVLAGPHVDNFRDTFRALVRQKGALEVKSAADIAAAVRRLLGDPGELERMQRKSEEALRSMSGALPRTLEQILPLLALPRGVLARAP